MFTLREVQRRATIAVVVIFFLSVPLACPLAKVIMEWRDRRKYARSDYENGQTAGVT